MKCIILSIISDTSLCMCVCVCVCVYVCVCACCVTCMYVTISYVCLGIKLYPFVYYNVQLRMFLFFVGLFI